MGQHDTSKVRKSIREYRLHPADDTRLIVTCFRRVTIRLRRSRCNRCELPRTTLLIEPLWKRVPSPSNRKSLPSRRTTGTRRARAQDLYSTLAYHLLAGK